LTGISIEDNDALSFPGKIAVITSPFLTSEDDYYSPNSLLAKYGPDKIIHVTWPVNFLDRQERMIDIVTGLSADMEIRAMIFNQAVPGCNAAVNKLRERRNDIFIVYCSGHEAANVSYSHANLHLEPNALDMGSEMAMQARKQGAKVFVHYSFPRHMIQPSLSGRRDLVKETCAAEGIQFIDTEIPDPVEEAGLSAARQFIIDDVPRMVAKYGEDTAFFCTNCHLQADLIRAIVASRAIYPQPCCPSPYHGFPQAFGIETGDGLADLNALINEISSIAAEKNMTDRLSTWPVSASMMIANAGAEYAIKWIRGEVPRNRLDDRALEDCMNSYVRGVVGEGVEVTMISYSENGKVYDNIKLVLMSYLDL